MLVSTSVAHASKEATEPPKETVVLKAGDSFPLLKGASVLRSSKRVYELGITKEHRDKISGVEFATQLCEQHIGARGKFMRNGQFDPQAFATACNETPLQKTTSFVVPGPRELVRQPSRQQTSMAEQTITYLKSVVSNAERRIVALEETVRTRNEDLRKKEAELARAHETAREKTAALAEAETNLATLQATLTAKEAELQEAKDQVNTLTRERDAAKTAVKNLEGEVSALKGRIALQRYVIIVLTVFLVGCLLGFLRERHLRKSPQEARLRVLKPKDDDPTQIGDLFKEKDKKPQGTALVVVESEEAASEEDKAA